MNKAGKEKSGHPTSSAPITSFRNPLVRRIKRLRRKKHRKTEGAYFIEGLRVVLSALETGAPVEFIVHCPELLTSPAGLSAVAGWKKSGQPTIELSAGVFKGISQRENPVGLGAVVRARWMAADDLPIQSDSLLVALVEVGEPGNLGTILRTADAAGVAGIILTGPCVDPFHPSAVKASMGAIYQVPVAQMEGPDELLAWARGRGLFTIATSARTGVPYLEGEHRRPALLILGSEGEGLPSDVLDMADVTLTIPMRGISSSLNLAVAAGIFLYGLGRPPG